MTLQRRRFLAGMLATIPAMAGAEPYLPSPDGGLSQRPPSRPAPKPADLIARAGLGGQVAFAVIDPASGAVLDQTPAQPELPPASTLKSVTALYALDRLGGDHRFRTRILRAGDMLVLAGGGDPQLDTDGLAELAARLVATGQTSPARFAVWGGALPYMAEIAPPQADHLAYNPSLSGMILNFNRVHLSWRQGGADLSLQARADHNSPRAYTVTAAPAAQQALFGYGASDGKERWTVARGAMRRAGSRWLPVRHPELYAGDVFQTLCRAKGLVLPSPEVIDTLPEGTEIAALDSPPLRDILRDMLKYSTNLTAEVVGLTASGARDLAASGAAMRAWVQAQGITGAYHFADHSGLSPDSRISALEMTRLLVRPDSRSALQPLLKRDPLAEDLGRDPAPRAVVEAKTGTLNFVSNLAGYASGPDGRAIGFTIFCADPDRRAASEGRELPPGAADWIQRAKALQRDLIAGWTAA